jgi:DNA-binding HxlR family transcriptional regulator
MHETCTVYNTLEYVSRKWTMMTLFEMRRSGEWVRFNDLKAKLGDITPKILSERLKELEQEGLIEHRVDSSAVPIKSEYRLTQSGFELTDIILDIKMWALKWQIDNKPCERMNCCKCRL